MQKGGSCSSPGVPCAVFAGSTMDSLEDPVTHHTPVRHLSMVASLPFRRFCNHWGASLGFNGLPITKAYFTTSSALAGFKDTDVILGMVSIHIFTWKTLSSSVCLRRLF